jgi:predicted dehydrogenase
MDDFRWAYIGCGSIARKTAKDISRGSHRITAVYSRNPQKAADFAGKYGSRLFENVDEMLASDCFDGVYIATPHSSHCAYSIKALEAGKSVLCEKPAAVNLKEIDSVIDLSQKNGVYFCEAMWTWFSDLALGIRERVSGGDIGAVKSVKIEYAFPGVLMSRDSRLLMPETAGGALLDIGVYPIAYCLSLFGFPQTVTCRGKVKSGIDIAEKIILGYDGFDCTLKVSLRNLRESCVIKGASGTISVPSFYAAGSAQIKKGGNAETIRGVTDYLTEFTRAAQEIRQGRTESAYVPHSFTRQCVMIADECRRQMNLKYPFE